MTNPDKSEFQLIDWITQNVGPLAPDTLTGIGDDMAVLRHHAEQILFTTDTLLENVHFDLTCATLEQVGSKALACSLSDCAAMAALPWVAVVAVSLPNHLSLSDAQQLHLGLQRAAQKYSCPIVGGDTTSWDRPLALTVSMLARAAGVEPVLRSGAQPDDTIIVTGSLGGSRSGKHLDFEPRITEARLLAQLTTLHALIDLSDGLSSDLTHLCRQSHVTALIESNKIPLSPATQDSPDPLHAALSDGEDFELLFTLNPHDANQLLKTWPQHSHLPLTLIGRITHPQPNQPHPISLQSPNGTTSPLPPQGYQHFK